MTIINHTLANKKVLVTGATGFIGGRLAQRLAAEENAIVTATGRKLDNVPFLQMLNVTLAKADLLDEKRMSELITGQAIIFHVAAWLSHSSDDADKAYAINVTATETLIRAAAEAGVQRVIVVSSMTAYGFPAPNTPHVTEEMPLDLTQEDTYGRTKAQGETRALALGQELGIEVVVVRPGMVYGPRGESYTVQTLKLVRSGVPCLVGDGSGNAFPVFVDNLIDGMLLTAVSPNAPGEAFQFIDPPVNWRTFFGYYGAMCNKNPRGMPLWGAKIVGTVRDLFNLRLPLSRQRVRFLTLPTIYPTTKAETLLGYQPRLSIEEGMQQSEAWLREEGYL